MQQQTLKNQGVFVKHYAHGGNKVWKKAIFSTKVKVKVIHLGVIWKGIISWVGMPNMKSLSLIANVKVDNRQDGTKTICPQSFNQGT